MKNKHDTANPTEYRRNLAKTLLEIQIDADWSEQQLDYQDLQFNRRSFIKNVIEFIEIYIWFLKSIYITNSNTKSDIEVAYLESNSTLLKQLSKDYPIEQIVIKNIKDDLVKILSMFEKTQNSSFDLDTKESVDMLEKLQQLKTIRNRISHPKNYTDIVILQSEVSIAKELYAWLSEKTYLWFENIVDYIEKNNKANI